MYLRLLLIHGCISSRILDRIQNKVTYRVLNFCGVELEVSVGIAKIVIQRGTHLPVIIPEILEI